MIFKDRKDAGKRLGKLLENFRGKDALVYALPRGGVIAGIEVSKAIHAPLDLVITRKLGHPYSPEYAIGAISENGNAVINQEEASQIDPRYLREEIERQKEEAKRRREIYLSGRRPLSCRGKVAIIVDDGIATGLTMKAAINEVKLHCFPKRIVIAVPVAPYEVANELKDQGVEVVALDIPKEFKGSLGSYYKDFPQVTDYEVLTLMKGEKCQSPFLAPQI